MTEGLQLMVVGMAVVFVALSLLMTGITLLSRLLHWRDRRHAQVLPGVADPSGTPTPEYPAIDGQLLAILAAAATAALGTRARVRRVRFVGWDPTVSRNWVLMGRGRHHASHIQTRR